MVVHLEASRWLGRLEQREIERANALMEIGPMISSRTVTVMATSFALFVLGVIVGTLIGSKWLHHNDLVRLQLLSRGRPAVDGLPTERQSAIPYEYEIRFENDESVPGMNRLMLYAGVNRHGRVIDASLSYEVPGGSWQTIQLLGANLFQTFRTNEDQTWGLVDIDHDMRYDLIRPFTEIPGVSGEHYVLIPVQGRWIPGRLMNDDEVMTIDDNVAFRYGAGVWQRLSQ